MTRNGKIARLPKAVRGELNRRLADGEPGKRLVAWLNSIPEVRTVLAAEFAGRPITENNLSEWKSGGFREWERQQELLATARTLTEQADELRESAGRLTDHLATVLTVRLAEVLRAGEANGEGAEAKELRCLRALCAVVAELRRGDHSAARLRLEQERREAEREKTEEEILGLFERWATTPALAGLLADPGLTAEQKRQRLRSVLGYGEEEPADAGLQLAREEPPPRPPASPPPPEPPAESGAAPAGAGGPDDMAGTRRRTVEADHGIPAVGEVGPPPSRSAEPRSRDVHREDAGAGAWGDAGKLGWPGPAGAAIRLNPTESGRGYGSAPKLPTVRGP